MKRVIVIVITLAFIAVLSSANAQMFAMTFGNRDTVIKPVAWYKLDGNALDISGNGYDGTWGGTEAYSDGWATFNGASWIDTGITNQVASGLYATPSSRFTVSGWCRFDSAGTMIGRAGPSLFYRTFQIHRDASRLNTVVNGQNETHIEDFASTLFISVSWDGLSVRRYVNGVLISTTSAGTQTEEMEQKITIGARTNGTGFYLTGKTKDIRIFDRALSAANIQKIMGGTSAEPIEELQ